MLQDNQHDVSFTHSDHPCFQLAVTVDYNSNSNHKHCGNYQGRRGNRHGINDHAGGRNGGRQQFNGSGGDLHGAQRQQQHGGGVVSPYG